MGEARTSSIFRPLLCILLLTLLFSSFSPVVESENTNRVYSPCADTTVQVSDGFTFGIAFASRPAFFLNSNFSLQLSPCDRRLSLSPTKTRRSQSSDLKLMRSLYLPSAAPTSFRKIMVTWLHLLVENMRQGPTLLSLQIVHTL